jgi:selenide, water dikinase
MANDLAPDSSESDYPALTTGRHGPPEDPMTVATPPKPASVESTVPRLTELARFAGCAAKISQADLHKALAGLPVASDPRVLVGHDTSDDAAIIKLRDDLALVETVDIFPPIVDDAYDYGRIAATNALSDIYAMGGTPLVAVNLLAWPRDLVPFDVAAEVLRGGAARCAAAGTHLAGGHSIDDREPKYGLAVTGFGHPDTLLRNDAGRPGVPLTLTKPLGLGILNNRHKATGELFEEAVATMTALNDEASRAAVGAGHRCATDVTGFGLLGHLHKLARASGVTAVVDAGSVPYLDGARQSLADGFVPGGSRRNLDWVRPHLATELPEDELLLLADAQTSGGLLVAGELPGHPVIGELVPAGETTLVVR